VEAAMISIPSFAHMRPNYHRATAAAPPRRQG
jgi:hypothetical protein